MFQMAGDALDHLLNPPEEVERLAAELAGPAPDALVLLLAKRVALFQLEADQADAEVAAGKAGWRRYQTSAHRRLMITMRMLTFARRFQARKQASLRHVLDRTSRPPAQRIDELLPGRQQASRQAEAT
jgi:hypothetical protein